MRGEVYRLPSPRGAKGHEQQGTRYAVVVQSEDLWLSTRIVCPTSTSARPASFRPAVEIEDKTTYVLVEQLGAVDLQRLGRLVGYLTHAEMQDVDRALTTVLGLDL